MSHNERLVPGSVPGGALLIAGSCIGAGMLALPIVTGLAGFFPSMIAFFVSWAFMTFTAFLLVEINGWFSREVNLLSMVKESLGVPGRTVAWISYLLLFYSLLVAYTAASGSIFAAILESLFGFQISPPAASIFFTFLFGWIIYLGTRPTDVLNRFLMIGLIACYLGMILLGIFQVQPEYLIHVKPEYLFSSLPILVVSFGFQNMIPTLTGYMKGDLQRVKKAILLGSLMTLAVYSIWSFLVLGVVPPEGAGSIEESYRSGHEATYALRAALGSNKITYFAQGFAFFAIVTSFLAQGLSLSHFLADGFGKTPGRKNSHWFCLLALGPPLIFALSYPEIFFQALSFAGGICAMVLFGILPVLTAWAGRYKKKLSTYHPRGGKAALLFALAFSFLVIGCQVISLLRVS